MKMVNGFTDRDGAVQADETHDVRAQIDAECLSHLDEFTEKTAPSPTDEHIPNGLTQDEEQSNEDVRQSQLQDHPVHGPIAEFRPLLQLAREKNGMGVSENGNDKDNQEEYGFEQIVSVEFGYFRKGDVV